MRVYKYTRKEKYYLTELQLKKLLPRFNVKNAKEGRRKYTIYINCFLCSQTKPFTGCKMCSLMPVGCIKIMERIIGLEYAEWSFSFLPLSWHKSDDKKARKQLTMIYNTLKNLPKVKKGAK